MRFEETHVLLVLPLYFLVVADAVELHLTSPVLVPFLLLPLHLPLSLLAEALRLNLAAVVSVLLAEFALVPVRPPQVVLVYFLHQVASVFLGVGGVQTVLEG